MTLFTIVCCSLKTQAQEKQSINGYLVPMCIYNGDTIPCVQLRTVYIFRPLKFKNEKERREYYRLIRDVKKVLPISKEINRAIIETYEYLQTIPTEKGRQKHLKAVEKGLKEQYTPRMKKLSFAQGKLLIKLVDRQSNQTSYELVKAFMGPFKAGFYQAFAALFGASLKKEYDFVGLSNFIEILSDKYFWNSMWFTFKYVIVIVIVSNVAALTLAVAIESRRRAKGLYRTVFYMPNMISMVIGGYMWMFIFTKVLYYMADNWGWKFLDHSWIGDPKYSFIAIMIVAAWGATGYLMIIYMAALQGVPANLKEAASIDGADSWQNFWKIVFPLIGHAITICVFWALNAGFQVFDVIYTAPWRQDRIQEPERPGGRWKGAAGIPFLI